MRIFQNQFIRFLAVGVLNTLFGYGCYALFLRTGLSYPLALLLATIAGILFNFKTIGHLVFKSNNNFLIFRFILTYTIIYILNVLSIKGLEYVGMNPYYGGAILTFPMALVAYILNKRFVFNHD